LLAQKVTQKGHPGRTWPDGPLAFRPEKGIAGTRILRMLRHAAIQILFTAPCSLRSAMGNKVNTVLRQQFGIKNVVCPLFSLLQEKTFQEGIFLKSKRSSPNQPDPSPHAKKLFSIELTGPVRERASTNGSDCGSLRSHNLTLFVSLYLRNLHFYYSAK
jgi:hypothetical protein